MRAGLNAIVAYLLQLSKPLQPQLPDHEMTLDCWLCVSASAFRSYVFDPHLNPQYDQIEVEHHALALLFCNYGPFESLRYFSGLEIKDFNGLGHRDFLKLCHFELESDRKVLSLQADSLRPVLLESLHLNPLPMRIGMRAQNDAQLDELIWQEYDPDQGMQADSEIFQNFCAIVRAGERPDWAASSIKQKIAALRWAYKHGTVDREFFHETRDYYLPGPHSYTALANLRRQLDDQDDTEMVRTQTILQTHLAELHQGRAAAARELPRWADELDHADDLEIGDLHKAQHAIRQAATAYAELAEHLSPMLDEPEAAAIEAAAIIERAAIEHLKEVVRQIPQRF